MEKGDYSNAILEFKQAMKKYKRAKLNDDALNYIRTNMGLSYASQAGKSNQAAAKKQLSMITKRAYNDKKLLYNIAIANYHAGNQQEAITLLSLAIRKDEFYFQAYVSLEEIFKRNPKTLKDAQKINTRLTKAVEKQKRKNEIDVENQKNIIKKNNTEIDPRVIKRPDASKLRIVKKDDILQFNKTSTTTEKAMEKYIQEGVEEYYIGVEKLSNKNWTEGINNLKNSEKKLKRGKISEDGLSFVRGNLAIAYFALVSCENKKGLSQGKRLLKLLTNKIYKNKDESLDFRWNYNLGVSYYTLSFSSARIDKKTCTIKKETPTSIESRKEAIRLLKTAIKQERLFLPAYQNLMYIYNEMGDEEKVAKVYKSYEKAKNDLFKSLSKDEQQFLGGKKYIFRINVGEFGEFDTPAKLFSEDNVITIPITENKTSYLVGRFYNLDNASRHLEKLIKKGYKKAYIIANTDDGEVLEF